MKRLLVTSLLGLIVLLQVPGPVWACGAFGLFTCGGCCKKCGCEVCIRPFNAFSPVMCGSICVENCFPICGPHCACAPPMGGPLPPYPGGPLVAGPPPALMPPPKSPPPAALTPNSAPPLGSHTNPEETPPPSEGETTGMAPRGYSPWGGPTPYPMFQQVNYSPYPYPGYVPAYYPGVPQQPLMPAYPYPMMPPMPAYPYPMMPRYPVWQ